MCNNYNNRAKPRPNLARNLYRIGWSGRCNRTQNMVSGRIEIISDNATEAERVIRDFFNHTHTGLELYGTHLVYDKVA